LRIFEEDFFSDELNFFVNIVDFVWKISLGPPWDRVGPTMGLPWARHRILPYKKTFFPEIRSLTRIRKWILFLGPYVGGPKTVPFGGPRNKIHLRIRVNERISEKKSFFVW
jgi:hypothetical protein